MEMALINVWSTCMIHLVNISILDYLLQIFVCFWSFIVLYLFVGHYGQ